jgi:hypothetical protein
MTSGRSFANSALSSCPDSRPVLTASRPRVKSCSCRATWTSGEALEDAQPAPVANSRPTATRAIIGLAIPPRAVRVLSWLFISGLDSPKPCELPLALIRHRQRHLAFGGPSAGALPAHAAGDEAGVELGEVALRRVRGQEHARRWANGLAAASPRPPDSTDEVHGLGSSPLHARGRCAAASSRLSIRGCPHSGQASRSHGRSWPQHGQNFSDGGAAGCRGPSRHDWSTDARVSKRRRCGGSRRLRRRVIGLGGSPQPCRASDAGDSACRRTPERNCRCRQ